MCLSDFTICHFSFLSRSTAEGFFSRSDNSMVTGWETFLQALGYFLKMFFGSAALGTLTGLISALVSIYWTCVFVHFACMCASGLAINSLTPWLVSETLWPEEDTIPGIWYDDNICIPSLWFGRGNQALWWVHTLLSCNYQDFNMSKTDPVFLSDPLHPQE